MKRKRILVVDQNQDLCQSIREFLKDDFEVFVVNDGSQIVSQIEREKIDLLLTDLEIPNIYFYSIISTIKEHYPTIPIICMYIYCDQTQEMENTIRRMVDAIFLKPFDLNELKKRIKLLFKSKSLYSKTSLEKGPR